MRVRSPSMGVVVFECVCVCVCVCACECTSRKYTSGGRVRVGVRD